MMQPLLYVLFLLAGSVLTYLIFLSRLKKISGDLNEQVEKVRSSVTHAGKTTGTSEKSGNPFEVLGQLGEKIQSLVEIKAEPKPIEGEKNETKEQDGNLKQQLENLQVVNELGQRVTSSLNLQDTFDHLYNTINSIMDASVVELGVYYRRENRWNVISNMEKKNGTDPDGEYKNHMAEWCLHNNREIFLNDAEKEFSRYVFKPLILPDGRIAQSVMSFPVFRQDKECGSLTIISFRKNAFNEYHVDMLRSLLPYTAVALENALVHQELIVTQDQLIHNEKMASIGQLASGIAHEILNPLNFVNNFSQLSKELIGEIESSLSVEEQMELKTQLINNLDKINFHGGRAYDIVKSMMALSRTGKGDKEKTNINRCVDEFLSIAYHGFKIRSKEFECEFEKTLDDKLPETEMVSQDFGRVLINLFSNAFYAMNEKGKKVNSSSAASIADFKPRLKIKTGIVNSRIVVSVCDNGTGIPEEIKDKVFLPFFTTKPTGEGTGLGLSLSHDIITKGNRGELTFKTEPGRWTEFRVEIPVTQ